MSASLDQACRRATARERVLAAMAELAADELELLAVVAERLVAGRAAYGLLELATDRRCFKAEAAEELLDAVAYLAMDIVRAGRP